MRLALKFAYYAMPFQGYARQPKVRTVEGDIINALMHLSSAESVQELRFQSASRTDKGVSALGNVLAVNTKFKKFELLRALNSNLNDVWFYGVAEVSENFNPRHAKQRWYRYYLFERGLDLKALKNAVELFVGEHDFTNYARLERSPVRKIDSIDVQEMNDFVIIDFKAQSFLWNMVRRIVSVLVKVGRNEVALNDIRESLRPDIKVDYGLVESEFLVLMDVSYGFEFEVKENVLRKVRKEISDRIVHLRMDEEFYNVLLRKF